MADRSAKRATGHASVKPSQKAAASKRRQTAKPKTAAPRAKEKGAPSAPASRRHLSDAKRPAAPKASTRRRAASTATRKGASRPKPLQRGKARSAKKRASLGLRASDALCSFASFLGHFSKRTLIASAIACVFALGAIGTFATTEAHTKADLDGLPSYITEDMVSEARSARAHYGHPAGCTIAQIIVESGYQGHLSQLAEQDHNLFGMKWASSFEGADGVVGPATWTTNEEYGGQYVQIDDAFVSFESDRACIRFRSAVFLQASTYASNALIRQAIAENSSQLMAQGLQDAGWATDSNYANTLIAVMDQYNLYRFDS